MLLTVGFLKSFATRVKAPQETVLKFRFLEWDHKTTGWGLTNVCKKYRNEYGDLDWKNVDAFVIGLWKYSTFRDWFKPLDHDRPEYKSGHTATLEEFLEATKNVDDETEIIFRHTDKYDEDEAVQIGFSQPYYHCDESDGAWEVPTDIKGTLFESEFESRIKEKGKERPWNWYDYRSAITIKNYWRAEKDHPLEYFGLECFNPEHVDEIEFQRFKDNTQREVRSWEYAEAPEYKERPQARRIKGTASWDDYVEWIQRCVLQERDKCKRFLKSQKKWSEALRTEQLEEIRARNASAKAKRKPA